MTWPFENDTSAITKKLQSQQITKYCCCNSNRFNINAFYFCNDFMCWSDPVYTDNYFAN